jgi:uncharacterized protein (TIGR00106 family)
VSVIAAISVTPLGGSSVSEEGSVGATVAEVVRVVRESGLRHETNAMFTNVEGPLEEVMGLLERCVRCAMTLAPRVSVVVKLDVRPGHDDALSAKVSSVERHLERRDLTERGAISDP